MLPIVRNLETEPDDRTQLGNANAQGENNGTDPQANNAAPLDLETIITKMKHHYNAVTSVTGDFVMERHGGPEIEKDEYSLTFKGEKVRIEREKRRCRECTAHRVLGWKTELGGIPTRSR